MKYKLINKASTYFNWTGGPSNEFTTNDVASDNVIIKHDINIQEHNQHTVQKCR